MDLKQINEKIIDFSKKADEKFKKTIEGIKEKLKKIPKKIVYIIGGLVIGVLVIVTLLIVSSKPEESGITVKEVKTGIENLIGLEVLYSGMETDEKTGEIKLNGVYVNNPAEYEERTLALIKDISVIPHKKKDKYKVHLDKASIDVEELNIIINESGVSNLSKLRPLSRYTVVLMPTKDSPYYKKRIKETELLKKSLETNPDDLEKVARVAELYFEMREYKEAITYFSKAVELDPKNTAYRRRLADAYYYSGNMEEQIKQYEEIVKITPKDYEARKLLMLHYGWHGDYEKAIGIAKDLLEENPDDFVIREHLAEYYAYEGKNDKSIKELEKMKHKRKDDVAFRRKLGDHYAWGGNHGGAIGEYQAVLQKEPKDITTQEKLANNYSWSGLQKEAEEILKTQEEIKKEETNTFMLDSVEISIGKITLENRLEGFPKKTLPIKSVKTVLDNVEDSEQVFIDMILALSKQPQMNGIPLGLDVKRIEADKKK